MVLELDIIEVSYNFLTPSTHLTWSLGVSNGDSLLQLELPNEHREFISGRRNEKLKRLITSASVKTEFLSLNDHSFLIDVSGSSALNVLWRLAVLRDELCLPFPLERITAFAGHTIQRIQCHCWIELNQGSASACTRRRECAFRTRAKNKNLEHFQTSIVRLVLAVAERASVRYLDRPHSRSR